MTKLNKTDLQVRLKRGLRSALLSFVTAQFATAGEPHWTTDTYQLFVSDGTQMRPVQTLDMAVTYEGNVVVHDGGVVYQF
jgi:hypothetical protein